MPRIEKESTNDNQAITKVPVDTMEAPAEFDDKRDHRKTASPLTVVSIMLVFFIALFAVGGVFMFLRGNMIERRHNIAINLQESMPRMRPMYVREVSAATTSSSSQSIASGVVTSVNGSSFVIGGNGTKVTVDTSGSTTWNTTDKKVSVNDSVVVIGTESNSTITATSVRIANL